MITTCNYCDYKKETPFPENLLAVASDPTLPIEDQALWQRRLVQTVGTGDYNSVKIHMGIKHKGLVKKGEYPGGYFSPSEVAIIRKAYGTADL